MPLSELTQWQGKRGRGLGTRVGGEGKDKGNVKGETEDAGLKGRGATLSLSGEGYGFKTAGQLSTTVSGADGAVSPAGASIRNRWPSADTT